MVFELGRLDYFDYAVEFLFGVSFVLLLTKTRSAAAIIPMMRKIRVITSFLGFIGVLAGFVEPPAGDGGHQGVGR